VFRSGQFWLGFFGAIVGNVVLVTLVVTMASEGNGQLGTFIVGAPWVLNFGAIVLFAIVRPRIALGMLFAYGIAFGLALLGGIFIFITCATGGGGIP
jgi:hypothetical protein